jgi:hypothetical protein
VNSLTQNFNFATTTFFLLINLTILIMSRTIKIKDIEVKIKVSKENNDYICLTDMAKVRNNSEADDVVKNWMRTRYTITFLGLWEKMYNKNFKPVEFDGFRNSAGENSFTLSPEKWINSTNAIGMWTKRGRDDGGTYAHKDIAFEFGTWLSPEFKLYLIKEFQRLKEDETRRLSLDWNINRTLSKLNYKIHTDAIKEHIVPTLITKDQESYIYADEADILNVALFGKTAKQWRDENKGKEGNIRDHATIEQLLVLANMESVNAEFIKMNLSQGERLRKLNETAITQMKALLGRDAEGRLRFA